MVKPLCAFHLLANKILYLSWRPTMLWQTAPCTSQTVPSQVVFWSDSVRATVLDQAETRLGADSASVRLTWNPCSAWLRNRCTRWARPCSAGGAAFAGRTLEVGLFLSSRTTKISYSNSGTYICEILLSSRIITAETTARPWRRPDRAFRLCLEISPPFLCFH